MENIALLERVFALSCVENDLRFLRITSPNMKVAVGVCVLIAIVVLAAAGDAGVYRTAQYVTCAHSKPHFLSSE
jgi:hypothetical protein